MPHGKWADLSPGFQVACYRVGHMDSVLATKSQKHTILNLKDCETSISALKRLKGQPGHVDLLLDQFSTSGCPGNPHDVGQRRAAAHHVLDNFVRDIHTSTRTSLCRLLVLFGFGIRKTRTSIPLSIPHAEATNVTGDKLMRVNWRAIVSAAQLPRRTNIDAIGQW
jgi:hypothetical protein